MRRKVLLQNNFFSSEKRVIILRFVFYVLVQKLIQFFLLFCKCTLSLQANLIVPITRESNVHSQLHVHTSAEVSTPRRGQCYLEPEKVLRGKDEKPTPSAPSTTSQLIWRWRCVCFLLSWKHNMGFKIKITPKSFRQLPFWIAWQHKKCI